jgi:hypothetical protein
MILFSPLPSSGITFQRSINGSKGLKIMGPFYEIFLSGFMQPEPWAQVKISLVEEDGSLGFYMENR